MKDALHLRIGRSPLVHLSAIRSRDGGEIVWSATQTACGRRGIPVIGVAKGTDLCLQCTRNLKEFQGDLFSDP